MMIGKVRPHSDSLKSCCLDHRYSDVSRQASTRYTSTRHLTRLRAIEFQITIVPFGRKSSAYARGSVVPGLIVHSKTVGTILQMKDGTARSSVDLKALGAGGRR